MRKQEEHLLFVLENARSGKMSGGRVVHDNDDDEDDDGKAKQGKEKRQFFTRATSVSNNLPSSLNYWRANKLACKLPVCT